MQLIYNGKIHFFQCYDLLKFFFLINASAEKLNVRTESCSICFPPIYSCYDNVSTFHETFLLKFSGLKTKQHPQSTPIPFDVNCAIKNDLIFHDAHHMKLIFIMY